MLKKVYFYYLLSNNHILANSNSLPIGTEILQPTVARGANLKTDIVAHLSDYIPLKFIDGSNKPVNKVDVAIAKLVTPNLASFLIVGSSKIQGISTVNLNDAVNKFGASTGFTQGSVITIGLTIVIPFSHNESVLFQNQIKAKLYNSSGDSGSGVFNSTNDIVGLLFAGSEGGKYGYFNDINSVFKSMNLKLYNT